MTRRKCACVCLTCEFCVCQSHIHLSKPKLVHTPLERPFLSGGKKQAAEIPVQHLACR